jgi:hypothetical protein
MIVDLPGYRMYFIFQAINDVLKSSAQRRVQEVPLRFKPGYIDSVTIMVMGNIQFFCLTGGNNIMILTIFKYQ